MRKPGFWRRFMYRYDKAVRMLLTVICCAVLCVSAFLLGRYVLDAARARSASRKLQAVYHESVSAPRTDAVAAVTAQPDAAAVPTEPPTGLPQVTDAPQVAAPTSTKTVWQSSYPDNRYLTKNSAIQKLQRQNSDIIGWLSISSVLDEAVVQRNNEYYLNRDYKGYHNANGALFLDEACSLLNRPPLYVIYGHNMKTETMFGCLHKWDKASWYHDHPLIHWTALYEESDYVIFSVGSMQTTDLARYLTIWTLDDPVRWEQLQTAFIAHLEAQSIYMKQLDVSADDQLLLLVTCTGDNTERRFLAARKLRPSEIPESAAAKVRQSWRK